MTEMTPLQIMSQEWHNIGTTWTRNEDFDRDGYLGIESLWDPKELYHPVPKERGKMRWWGNKIDQFQYDEIEGQVEGSISRYNHPQYRRAHTGIRQKIEDIIGRKLYNTYYYDRFYFPGQKLSNHVDRDACEISVTMHVSSNLKEPWALWIKTPDNYSDKKNSHLISKGENRYIYLGSGDAVLYKGCERPHWRDPMPGLLETSLDYTKGNERKDLYYHQIFFHYVLQDGERAHCAWDMAR